MILNKLWFQTSVIVAVAIFVYSFMLFAPFKFWDDQFSIVENPLIKDPKFLTQIFRQGYFHDDHFYRPFVYVTYMGEYLAFGLNSFFYNLDNLLLHILNTFLVWSLIARLTNHGWWGFATALIFVIHPIQAEAVGNVSGRSILLSALFVLSAFNLFLLYEQTSRKFFLMGSIWLFGLSLLCKESSIMLVGVLFLYLWLKKKPLAEILPFALTALFYLGLRHYLGFSTSVAHTDLNAGIVAVITFLYSLLSGLVGLIFPVDLYFDRSQALFSSLSQPLALLTFLAIGVIGLILYKFRSRINGLGWFWIGWLLLEMFPVSQVVSAVYVAPKLISTADHFWYVACIPVFAAAAGWFHNLYQKKMLTSTVMAVITAGFLGMFAFLTIEQNILSCSEPKLMQRALDRQPGNARVLSNLGVIYAFNERYKEAEGYFRKALLNDPTNARYAISLSQSVCDQGRLEECLFMYERIKSSGDIQALIDQNKQAVVEKLFKTRL